MTNDKETRMIEKAAAEFAARVLAPDREEHDRYPFGPLFEDVLDKARDLGFFEMLLPEEYNGMGLSLGALCAVLTRVCQVDASLAGYVFTNALAHRLLLAGDADRALQKLAHAETTAQALVAACSFSRPSETRPGLTVTRRGRGYRLSGTLDYLVAAPVAVQAVVPAVFERQNTVGLFFVDLTQAGVQVGEPVHSLGWHACPAADVTMEDAPAMLVGEAGKGADLFDVVADEMAVAKAAMAAGILAGSCKQAVDYAKKREQGGRAIIRWSEMQMMLGRMTVAEQAAKMCVDQACAAAEARAPRWEVPCRAAAVHVCELASEMTTDGIQALGGVGYMKDYGQEKRFRDAKTTEALLGLAPLAMVRMAR